MPDRQGREAKLEQAQVRSLYSSLIIQFSSQKKLIANMFSHKTAHKGARLTPDSLINLSMHSPKKHTCAKEICCFIPRYTSSDTFQRCQGNANSIHFVRSRLVSSFGTLRKQHRIYHLSFLKSFGATCRCMFHRKLVIIQLDSTTNLKKW